MQAVLYYNADGMHNTKEGRLLMTAPCFSCQDVFLYQQKVNQVKDGGWSWLLFTHKGLGLHLWEGLGENMKWFVIPPWISLPRNAHP